MSKKIISLICFLAIIICLFIFSNSVAAHPGRTDDQGCHKCNTNCASWGLADGEYHCHTPKADTPPAPQPTANPEPVVTPSAPQPVVTPSPRPTPQPTPKPAPIPTCQANATYNSLTQKCECNPNFILSGKKRVTAESFCQSTLGDHSQYNPQSEKCECEADFFLHQRTKQCISGKSYCRQQLGAGGTYHSTTQSCRCLTGFMKINHRCQKIPTSLS